MQVIFGGLTGYSSDDINKFLWPVRIGAGTFRLFACLFVCLFVKLVG